MRNSMEFPTVSNYSVSKSEIQIAGYSEIPAVPDFLNGSSAVRPSVHTACCDVIDQGAAPNLDGRPECARDVIDNRRGEQQQVQPRQKHTKRVRMCVCVNAPRREATRIALVPPFISKSK